MYVSRVGTIQFDAESIVGWTIFHALDIAAVLVLAGVFIFLRRRLRDPGALAVERSGDFLALAGLFAVSVTGLFLTVSSTVARGPLLLGAEHDPCADGDPRADVHPVRQAVPHLPAARQPRASPTTSGPTPRARRPSVGDAATSSPAPSRSPTCKEVLPQVGFDYDVGDGDAAATRTRARRAAATQVALAQSARVGGFG